MKKYLAELLKESGEEIRGFFQNIIYGADNFMEETKVESSCKIQRYCFKIEEMSVIDLHELVKVLEAKFGVSAAAVCNSWTSGCR